MNYCMRRALHRLECLLNDMLSCLGQHLHRHVIRNHILLDQCPHKLILRFRRCRKSHLNLFKADIHQHLEKLKLLFQTHRFDKRLVPVTQVDAAPDRRFVNILLLYPVICDLGRHKICSFIFVTISHNLHPLFLYLLRTFEIFPAPAFLPPDSILFAGIIIINFIALF